MTSNTSNMLRVLISTDNHLGYCEKDPVRGEDSFRTFQEILKLAQEQQVDMLLLAGDLFHDNKPSRKTLYQTMSLLRSHCMGDGAVRFQIVSDQSINFPNFGTVNYEDPNYNVQLPIFSIHGNHDDPAREAGGSGSMQQSLAALDLLSAANFINYFGKSDKVDAIEVFPILMVKGTTQIAIYGLGNMRDERLNRMFAQKKVVFRRPAENPQDWFSIFVVHQNRDNRGRGAKNCIPESFIPDFIDFVIWGHEHECLIDASESVKGDFYITQPGSSVATSLVEGEAKRKHVAVLEIKDQFFRMTNHVLKTVRPFQIGEIVLSEVEELDPNDPDVTDRITEVLEHRVLELLREAKREQQEIGNTLDQVLVRLRVEHSGFPVLHNQRFGSRFVGKIANPNDILLFYRRKKDRNASKSEKRSSAMALNEPIRPTRLDMVTIEDILTKQLHKPDQKLVFLPESSLANALDDYIKKNIPSAIDEIVDQVLEETQHELAKCKDAKSKQDIVSAVEKKKEKVNAEHEVAQEEQGVNESQQSVRGEGFQESLRSQSLSQATRRSVAEETPSKSSRSSRFGTPRSALSASSPMATSASSRDVLEESDEELPATTSPARRSRSTTPTSRKRAAPARSSGAKGKSKATRGKRKEEEEEDEEDVVVDDDGDNDYQEEEEEEEEDRPAPRSRKRTPTKATRATKAKATKAPATASRKRLRKAFASNDEEDEDDNFSTTNPSKRPPVAPKPVKSNAIDLCSSDSEPSRSSSKRPKPTPQPKIHQFFKSDPQNQNHEDEVESDAEFTELTTAAPVAAVPSSQMTQSQSQSQVFGSQKRKLPLSMLASSQSTTPSARMKKEGDGASAVRRGWGRSRR